jgi:hypothetical protein
MVTSELNQKNYNVKCFFSYLKYYILVCTSLQIQGVTDWEQETMSFYTTKTQNNKGNNLTITRENISFVRNDLEYLLKLFSTIIPLMILDKKFRLYVE